MENQVKIGDRFKLVDEWPYRDNGKMGMHRMVKIIEVTDFEFKNTNAKYKVVEVLEESGRPSWGSSPIGNTGGFSVDAYKRGRLTRFEKVEAK